MKFENFLKKLSSIVAGIAVFLLAFGTYMSMKGFVLNPDGSIVLVKNAQAADKVGAKGEIAPNLLIPWGPQLGSNKAKVTIYEFSSFGCYHCAQFQLKTLPQIKAKYIDSGLVRLIFDDFPLDKNSMQASLLAHCFDGEKFFRVADQLFEKQREWGLTSDPKKYFIKYAALNGLTSDAAEKCLTDKEKAEEIIQVRQFGIANLAISGTPSFVISSVKGREIIYGTPNFAQFDELIKKYMPDDKK